MLCKCSGKYIDIYFILKITFPHSKPHSAASIKPRNKYEVFFSVSDPPEPVHIFMSLYQRISEIQPTSSERAARLLRESRPLFNILPLRRRAVSIDDNSDFVTNASQFRLFTHL